MNTSEPEPGKEPDLKSQDIEANAPKHQGSAMKDMLWSFMSSGGTSVAQFLVLILTSRFMTTSEVGWSQNLLTVTAVSSMLSQMGMEPAIIQRPVLTRAHITSGIIASVVVGLLSTLTIIVLAGPIANFLNTPEIKLWLQIVSVVFAFSAFARITSACMMRKLRFKRVAQIDILSTGLYGVLAIGLSYFGFGAWSTVIALVSQALLSAVLTLASEPPPLPLKFEKAAYKDLMSVAGGFTAGSVLGQAASIADNVVVSRYLGKIDLAYYSRAYSLMARPATVLSTSVVRVLHPHMAKVQSEPEKLKPLFIKCAVGTASLALPVGLFAAVLAPEIILGLLGEKFAHSVIPFQIFAAGMIFRISNDSGDAITRAVGDMHGRVVPKTAYLLSIIAFAFIGTHWGLVGVSVGVLMGNVVHTVGVNIYGFRHANMTWGEYFRVHKAPLLLGLAASVPTLGVASLLRAVHLPHLVILFVGAACSAGCVFALLKFGEGLLGEELKGAKGSLVKILLRRKAA